jgi:type IX secretion system PorP/SprF family membrane protein
MRKLIPTMMRTNKIVLLAFASGTMGISSAQDTHLSQYEAAPVLLNPALTGMFEHSDFRMGANLRSQWNRLSSNFLTTAFAYDVGIDNRYGVGFYLNNYDMAGMMNTFEAGLAGSYNVSAKNAKHTLSVGLRLGIIHKKVNDADMLFDMQYDNGTFDPDLPTGELIEKRSRLLPEIALGLAYRSIDPNRLLNPIASFSAFHLTTPDETIFRMVKSDLPIRWTFMGGVAIKVTDELRLTPMGLFMLQRKDREISAGMMGELGFDGSPYGLVLGGSYRLKDAIVAHAGVKHRNNVYRVSYDITTSPLKEFNNSTGALEFSIIYYGTHSGRDRRVRRAKM